MSKIQEARDYIFSITAGHPGAVNSMLYTTRGKFTYYSYVNSTSYFKEK